MGKGRIFFASLAIMILLIATNVMAAAKEPDPGNINNNKNIVNEEDIITITYPYFYGYYVPVGQEMVIRNANIELVVKNTGKKLNAQMVNEDGTPIEKYTFFADGTGFVNLYFKINPTGLTEKERVAIEEKSKKQDKDINDIAKEEAPENVNHVHIKIFVIIICIIGMVCCWMYLLKSIPKPQNKKHDCSENNEEDEEDKDYIREEDEEDEDYVWDENEQDIKTAKERLQRLFPFTSFTVSESDIYDSYGRFDTIDGNTYELAEQSGLGYVTYVLFDRHTGKVIDDWFVVDEEDEEDEDKEWNRIAVMAKSRLQSIYPGTSFVINNYWNDDLVEFEEEPLACLISHDAGFHAYTVTCVEYTSNMSLILIHDTWTGKLIDSFTTQAHIA